MTAIEDEPMPALRFVPSPLLASVAVLVVACSGPRPDFIECRDDMSCYEGGRCGVNPATGHKFCQYPDEECPSGFRWSDLDVEDSISGQCVALEDPDAGVDGPDGSPDAMPDSGGDGGTGGEVVPKDYRLAAGSSHTCALVGTSVRCWGNGLSGRLGYGNTNDIGDNETPASAGNVNVGATVAAVVVGNIHTCALTTAGTVRCWGYGGAGAIGYGNTNNIGDDEAPATAGDVDVGGMVVQLATGRAHTCALIVGGAVRCWGESTTGQLGYANTTRIGDNEAPSTAGDVYVGGTVVQIAAAGDHTCALLTDGAVRCWGWGNGGRLGYGNTATIGDNEHPAAAGNVDVGGRVVQIATGNDHTCALLETGTVRCWGMNTSGQLGLANTATIGDNEHPASVPVVDVGGTVVYIEAGHSHTCAVLVGGRVACWGEGDHGRLGYGDPFDVGDNEHPYTKGVVDVGGTVSSVALGWHHTCAKLQDGNVRCWGRGENGRLGYGDTNDIGDNETPASKGNVPFM